MPATPWCHGTGTSSAPVTAVTSEAGVPAPPRRAVAQGSRYLDLPWCASTGMRLLFSSGLASFMLTSRMPWS